MDERIKVLQKQKFRDSDMLRITMDIPRNKWLILQQEIRSESFGNIIEVPEADKLLDIPDSTSAIDIYA